MKNLKWLLAAVLFISFSTYSLAGEKRIKFNALPQKAQEFYNKNFGKMKIKNVEYDNEDRKYEIKMWNDISISFNSIGEWIEIDCNNNNPVPQSVIETFPMIAKNAFIKKYGNSKIIEIERNLKSTPNVTYKIEIIDSQSSFKEKIMMNQMGEIRIIN